MHPIVNRSAHTVLPEEACETPSSSAAWVKFLPKAIPTFGRHESVPARTAITIPVLKAFDCADLGLSADGFRREPATEHSTMPTITTAVPPRRTSPFEVSSVSG